MSTEKRSILNIEDDEIVAGIYRSRFEKAGYETEVVPDGQAGFYPCHWYRKTLRRISPSCLR